MQKSMIKEFKLLTEALSSNEKHNSDSGIIITESIGGKLERARTIKTYKDNKDKNNK